MSPLLIGETEAIFRPRRDFNFDLSSLHSSWKLPDILTALAGVTLGTTRYDVHVGKGGYVCG